MLQCRDESPIRHGPCALDGSRAGSVVST